MTIVYASKGPLAGRQVDIPEDQVKKATGEGGWAIEIKPGNQLVADPGAVYDENWVIPGYTTEDLKPFTGKGKNGEPSGQRSGHSSKTTGARTASGSKDEDEAE